ncbi:MAG: CPBP family intramembrane glutamic endopeptidase, partial [Salegentibacter mishustinae]|nr:CPBP family intramembrane glutamic endopeptidase [Salegentibacter mishustinae]
MTSFENNPKQLTPFSPWSSLLIFILLFFVAYFVAQFFAIIVAILIYNVPFDQVGTLFKAPFDEKSKKIIYIAQGLSHFLSFTVFGLLFYRLIDRQNVKRFFSTKRFTASQAILAIGATFFFMLFNSIIIEWNMNVEFPEFLKAFEQWARAMEDQLLELTTLLSTYENFGEMLLALLVIGVLPAVGEEIIFRGILQNKLYAIAKNPHVAIWTAAVIFGAFHLQFYGVLP